MSTRSRTRTGVVVTAHHPKLGPLYWTYVSEASVGGPDFYSISRSMAQALLLEADWREKDKALYGGHLQIVLRQQASVYRDREYWGVDEKVVFEGDLDGLQKESGQSEEEFFAWLQVADWLDAPGPTRIEHLVDHGYFESWELSSQTYPRARRSPAASLSLESGF
ncbi:hypothetical protein [Alteromonas macleodii]|uniref:hypothetical protein n=1 Tax=Alteromonas macleodii TaxID=28108 RepID=UPI001930BB76|nr:hypothetical protein [Alteromonas macleodii]